MMAREQVIKTLGRALTDHGFQGRGRHFSLVWPEVAWLFQLELIPRTTRVGIYVGVCPAVLAADGWPARANDCPIIFDPESGGEPFGLDHWTAWQALDTASDMPDEVRVDALASISRTVADVALRVTTVADLRRMAADGHVRGFVHRNARALLSGDNEAS